MTPVDARTRALVAEIRRDWESVGRALSRAESVDPAAGEAPAALVALSLDHAFQAFESLLLRVESGLGLPERVGSAWHAAVLADAGLPLPGLRPEVYPAAVRADWEALRGFRHFLRHAYSVDLDPERLRANVERLARAVEATDERVRGLTEALLADE